MVLIASTIFIIGYILITLEHHWKLHKAMTAVALGGSLWVLIVLGGGHDIEHALEAIGGEIFGLIAFLLAAMTLVEILIHYRLFDFIRVKMLGMGLTDFKQIWLIAGLAFFLSAIIDNLTTTIVMVQIARRFFRGENLLLAAAAIVIAANAGGAFSPIGDVTTIMLWLAGKFSATEIIAWGFLPSLALLGVSVSMMAGKIKRDTVDEKAESTVFSFSRSERVIVVSAFCAFTFPLIAHLMGLPPYIGLLFGLGMVGLLISLFSKTAPHRESHLSVDIERLLRSVDIASLLFFTGILLAVGALGYLGILATISHSVFGSNPELWRLVGGNALLGAVSAIVDNIPLTAAAIDIVSSDDPAIWALLAIAVGTGGSLLVIGSAAGVIAMGMIKELTFRKYFTIAFPPALAGYCAAIAVWFVQYVIFR